MIMHPTFFLETFSISRYVLTSSEDYVIFEGGIIDTVKLLYNMIIM